MTAAKTTQTTTPEPPAAAVAADAHWTVTRDRLRNRQRPIAPLTICDDLAVKKTLEQARFNVRRIELTLAETPDDADLKKELAAAVTDLEKAKADFDEVAIPLEFQALRRPDFEELKKNHPPTEAQAEDNLVVNVETIGPVLIAACSLDGITVEDAEYYLTEWSEGEAGALFNAAWNVQTGARMDMGKG